MKQFKLNVMIIIILFIFSSFTISFAADNKLPIRPSIAYVELTGEVDDTSNIIFKDNFEGTASMSAKYTAYNDHNGDCVALDGVGLGGSKGLRVHWKAGQVDAGSFWYMFGRNPVATQSHSDSDFQDIYWRFYMKTSKGWTGNPHKLTRATVLVNTNWAQAMIAHLWGAAGDLVMKIDPVSCVSDGQVISSGYNDYAAMQWLNADVGVTPVYDPSMSNIWHLIEIHVKLNTPGMADGIFEFWVDNNLERRMDNLNFVGTWQEYGINAISFGNYWNGGAIKDQERYIDNIVISSSPIGWALSPVNPTVHKTEFEDPDIDDSQSAFKVQVSTSPDEIGLVWSGEEFSNKNSIIIDTNSGSFQGTLSNKSELEGGALYYVRAMQIDNSGGVSEWSSWKGFKTNSNLGRLARPENLRIIDTP